MVECRGIEPGIPGKGLFGFAVPVIAKQGSKDSVQQKSVDREADRRALAQRNFSLYLRDLPDFDQVFWGQASRFLGLSADPLARVVLALIPIETSLFKKIE